MTDETGLPGGGEPTDAHRILRGTVLWFEIDRRYGKIAGDDGREYFVHENFLSPDSGPEVLDRGERVQFSPVEHERGPQAHQVQLQAPSTNDPDYQDAEHAAHCFVVMPYGRDNREIRWFRGWYETIIEPTVVGLGYEPILAANERTPNAINDEIRTHLALDPMVVVDLGGGSPDDSPNPNVMYEMGIRHALNLPLVMMSWEGQHLPFDISNQRVIMGRRELLDIEPTKERLRSFIDAARNGQFYRPMEAVGRIATIDRATETLGGESLLGVLAREVRDLRRSVSQRATFGSGDTRGRKVRPVPERRIRDLLSKADRKPLYVVHFEAGGDPGSWNNFLQTPVASLGSDDPHSWAAEDWERATREAGERASAIGRAHEEGTSSTEGPSATDPMLPT